MKTHELRTHNDKMDAEISIIWDIFEKSPHQMSIVHGFDDRKCELKQYRQPTHIFFQL